ncbi:MAG: nucleoside deaminase [Pyrinomonadaceae bacterium]|nr:nucleoside deaminase [Phycisphaerales bacterium]
MTEAIAQARAGIAAGQSPFGAIIVRHDVVIARGHNQVWLRTDPTAHAEVVCIQNAGKALASIDLSGCEMYTTTEPCPMCASAIHWSKLDSVYYGATIADAMNAGFTELTLSIDDVFKQGGSRVRAVGGVMQTECAALFDEWKRAGGKSY